MSLFYYLNGWAGQWPWLDFLARFFYVGVVPLLATVLAGFLILAPRREDGHSRRRIAIATVLALLLCALTMAAVNGFAASVLQTDNLSPRPYMTRFVTPLIIEPNDNSFPAPEMMVAAVFATALLAASPVMGMACWFGVLLLGLARIFCGSNYPADVVAGALLGGAWCALCLSLLQVRLQLPARGGVRLVWRTRHQAVLSGGVATGVLMVSLYVFLSTPRFIAHRHLPWSTPAASAAPSSESTQATNMMAEGVVPEGSAPEVSDDSMAVIPASRSLLDSEVVRLDGHLPRAEELLSKALQNIGLGHEIVGVNVAAIKAGTSGYRCAAVRFEVKGEGADERRRVTETAARIARRCFHADGQLRTVDIIGVVRRSDAARDGEIGEITETTVFSASVQDHNLKLESGPAWLNWPKVDPGLWLRARSELYFDPQILPAHPASTTDKSKFGGDS